MTRINPLSNVGTSKTFLELHAGPKNPQKIAECLKVTTPTVIEQLLRLQEVGLVVKCEKIGRIQNYAINWKKATKLLIESIIGKNELSNSSENERAIEKLYGNIIFEEATKRYIYEILQKNTLLQAIESFKRGLLHSTSFKGKRQYNTKVEQEYFEGMCGLYKTARDSMDPLELTMQDEFTKPLFPKKKN